MTRRKRRNKKTKGWLYLFLIAIVLIITIYLISSRQDKDINVKKSISRKNLQKVDVKKVHSKVNVSESIAKVVKLLKIPDSAYKMWSGKDAIYYYLGINRRKLDLNYANMLLTSYVENGGGILIKGDEIGSNYRQVVTFQDPQDKQMYTIRIYYDKSGGYGRSKAKVAIVVDDFGYINGGLLTKFINLPEEVTFAILPHQAHSVESMQKSVQKGHETIIHMPMEPISYPRNNPGPYAIYVQQSPKEIRQRVEKYIKELNLCVGANNHMGSLITADKDVMTIVLSVLKEHNLFFIDSRTTASSIAYKTAQNMLIPSFENEFFLDQPDISPKNLRAKVNQIRNILKKKKQIVVITHCTSEEKYQYLTKIINELKKANIGLIPVSELFKNNLPKIL